MQTDEPNPSLNLAPRKRVRSTSTQASIDEELLARRWLKRNGYYMAKHTDLSLSMYHHFLSCLRMPRGRADKAGSQQAAFSMTIPSKMAATKLMEGVPPMGRMGKSKYQINAKGEIEWKPTTTITSYYISEVKALAKFLSLHRRGLGFQGWGATKAVPSSGGYEAANVVISLVPPLIMELCERSHGRLILEVTCNLMTLNDDSVHKLPPGFAYTSEQSQHLVQMARHSLAEMRCRGVALSPKFLEQIGDGDWAYDCDGSDGSDDEC